MNKLPDKPKLHDDGLTRIEIVYPRKTRIEGYAATKLLRSYKVRIAHIINRTKEIHEGVKSSEVYGRWNGKEGILIAGYASRLNHLATILANEAELLRHDMHILEKQIITRVDN